MSWRRHRAYLLFSQAPSSHARPLYSTSRRFPPVPQILFSTNFSRRTTT
jgi:hypothetical protein